MSRPLFPHPLVFQSPQVAAEELPDGSVTTVDLANDAVTTAKIADGAITTAKLPPRSAPFAWTSDYRTNDTWLIPPDGVWYVASQVVITPTIDTTQRPVFLLASLNGNARFAGGGTAYGFNIWTRLYSGGSDQPSGAAPADGTILTGNPIELGTGDNVTYGQGLSFPFSQFYWYVATGTGAGVPQRYKMGIMVESQATTFVTRVRQHTLEVLLFP
jgi:hypothetical protein